MRTTLVVVGSLMIAASAFLFMYPGVLWNQREQVAQLGDVHITANTERTVVFPPIAVGGLLAAGIILLVIGAGRK